MEHRLVLLGALAFAATAAWARLRGRHVWVSVLTGLPAVVVGGLAYELPDGLFVQRAGLILIPAADLDAGRPS